VDIIESRIAKKGGGGKTRSETFIVIGLGNGLYGEAQKKLLDMSCKGQGIYKQVADATGDITAERVEYNLQEALLLFSTYFTQKNTMNKRDIVTYSEVYGSSWDGKSEGMETTTASVPVYDKTDPQRWKFLGVSGIDVAVCALEKTLLEKNPNMQDIPATPEATVISDCKCATSYQYTSGGKTTKYEGGICTMENWPVAWCATEGCGIEIDSKYISTGFWAECKPFGVRAELESLLKKTSGEECAKENLNLCELEALRPAAHKCGADSGCPAMDFVPELEGYNYREKMPGFSAITASDWKANTAGSYEETEWSMSHGNCDQCFNTAVRPSCALPAKCNKGVPVCCAAPRTFAQAV